MKRSVCAVVASLVAVVVFVSAGFAVPVPSSASGTPAAQRAQNDSTAEATSESPTVVATIGDYTITKDELTQRLKSEVRPSREEDLGRQEPPTPESVLRVMIAEKAMVLEGRRLGYLDGDPIVRSYLERQRQRKLAGLLVTRYIKEKLSVDKSEIDEMQKKDPKLTPEQARMTVYRAKGIALLERYYKQLLEKFHFAEVEKNFTKASEVHDRLLNQPAEPRKESWIKNSQVRSELTKEERALVLATYDGGSITLQKWLETLCEIVPPRRPKDLGTPEGVRRLLAGALRPAILVAQAKALGYDKDETLLAEIRQLEDRSLLGKVQGEKVRDLPEPNAAQIRAYFDEHKERFADSASLKVEQIWCKDLETARTVKEALAGGADFESVKNAHSLQKSGEPYSIYPGGEGLFWDDLWDGEPNDVVGPVKGFYATGIRWRIVKILEKTPAKMKPFSDDVANRVKWAILGARRKEILDNYRKELLEKYAYELYAERIRDIDALAVTEGDETSR